MRRDKRSRRLARSHAFVLPLLLLAAPVAYAVATMEAPAGFDNLTNGFEPQTQFDLDRAVFEERDNIADGLGPVYNAQSCAECHQSPVTGAASQITELRVGQMDAAGNYTEPVSGSLINDRAIDSSLQEHASERDNVMALRSSLGILGDGYVEVLPDSAFLQIQAAQPPAMKGTIVRVPVLEMPGVTRIGRFGWKDQHASLISFAADAYLNEIGITSPLLPGENSSKGKSVADFDTVADPEDEATPTAPMGADVEAFARFMRSTKVPPRDLAVAAMPDAQAGAALFHQIGCDICHTASLRTAPAGSVTHGMNRDRPVPPALGDKVIHPFSDFMLHDVGTGDGIVQNGGPGTAHKLRTAPLWGLRMRPRLMHDLASVTYPQAILRHAREAGPVIQTYKNLSQAQRNQLSLFLSSL
jgi:CxxC motif-containing protein (DUF1111 family)